MTAKGTAEELIQLIREIPVSGWSNEEAFLDFRGVGLWLRNSDAFNTNAEIADTLRDLYYSARSDTK